MEDERLSIDALIAQARREARLEVAAEAQAEAAEQARLHAAFEAGAPLVTQVPLDLYDPVDDTVAQVPGSTVLTVAEHEGDILVGRLSDNSHSIGVVYEEPHRWTPRKYFLPLAALVDVAKVSTDDATAQADFDAERAKGLSLSADAAGTEVAVRALADLLLRDERAVLPRGVALVLRNGATARDGEVLPPGTRAVVVEAVDDFDVEAGEPDIAVQVDGRALALPYAILGELDPQADVLSAREVETLQQQALDRRTLLRRGAGAAGAVGLLAVDAAWYAQSPGHDVAKAQVLSALAPQLAGLVGYFGAGGKYWYELRGKLFELRDQGCLQSVRPLAAVSTHVANHSGGLWSTYERCFHRRVHTGWSETRHYRTDKDGQRHYTHSTWSKTYSTLWVEPAGVTGSWPMVEGWAEGDLHRHERCQRLLNERIFQLLETAPSDAERDFHLHRLELSFARDATISALSAAVAVLPAAFWDDFVAWVRGGRRPPPGKHPLQKPGLLLLGAVAGIVLAEKQRRDLGATMRQNKYDLGAQLETQLGDVPTLTVDDAWVTFFDSAPPRQLPAEVAGRSAECGRIAANAQSYTFTYGSGWDSGRALDSIRVDAGPVREAFRAGAPLWTRQATALARITRDEAHLARLLPVLRNAVGTEVLDAQMQDDEGEAKGGMWKRSLMLAAPLWGAAVLDAVFRRW